MIGISDFLDGNAPDVDGFRNAIHHDVERSHVVRVPGVQVGPFTGQILHDGIHSSAGSAVQGGLVAVISHVDVGFQLLDERFTLP